MPHMETGQDHEMVKLFIQDENTADGKALSLLRSLFL